MLKYIPDPKISDVIVSTGIKMKIIDDLIKKIDRIQQKHSVIGLPYAVIKRYGDDKIGYQAALITYYGFLSLFPLLLVTASIVSLVVQNNERLELSIMSNISNYFPVIGQQLTQNIHGSSESGLALILGLLIALYGARGGVDAFKSAVNYVWKVPKEKQPGFPESMLISMSMIIIGGIGIYSAAILSTYASGLGDTLVFNILSILVSFLVLAPTFFFLLTASLGTDTANRKDRWIMSVSSSIGLLVIQSFGGYLIANQLQKLSPLYGTFALVLGLIFWIYLQATVVMYATQTRYIRRYNLWPRSLSGKLPTNADRQSSSK